MVRKRITNEIYGGIADAVQKLGREHFASEADVIRERNASQFNKPVWSARGWTRGARIYSPKQEVLLLRDSLLLDYKLAQRAVTANAQARFFYQSKKTFNKYKKQVEKEADKLPEKRSVLILPSRDTFRINDEENFGVLRFLAEGKQTGKKFLVRLREKVIPYLTFYLLDSQEVDKESQPFIEQSWLNSLYYVSDFIGNHESLGDPDRAFGVFPGTSEARAHKTLNI